VRRRAWIAWGCLALGIVFGILGRVLPGADTWNLLAGILFLAAIVLGLSLLRLAQRVMPALVDFPDLFDRPRLNERWCATCGHPTGAKGPCRTCGATPSPTSASRGR
jgi:hypothetical protein